MKKIFLTLVVMAFPLATQAKDTPQMPQKIFDTAVNAMSLGYCSLDRSARLPQMIDTVRQCYYSTNNHSPDLKICVFEDQILASFVHTYRHKAEEMGDEDITAGIKFVSSDSFETRYDNKTFFLYNQNLNYAQNLDYQFHYFYDRMREAFDVLNDICKKLRR